MKEKEEIYVKRIQRDHSLSFKLQVVAKIESGELSINGSLNKYGIQSHGTVLNWVRRFGTFDKEYQIKSQMEKAPKQKTIEF